MYEMYIEGNTSNRSVLAVNHNHNLESYFVLCEEFYFHSIRGSVGCSQPGHYFRYVFDAMASDENTIRASHT
jgi:hypothetical protein